MVKEKKTADVQEGYEVDDRAIDTLFMGFTQAEVVWQYISGSSSFPLKIHRYKKQYTFVIM